MTKKEAHEFLGVSERTFDGYVKKYGLGVVYVPGKTGRRADYDAGEVEQLKADLEAPQSRATGVSAPSDDTDARALALVPQTGAIKSLRSSAPIGGAPLVVLSPEHLSALAQALAIGRERESEGVPVADRLTLTLDGAAALSGLSKGIIRQAISEGKLPAKKIGRGWKIGRPALETWVASLFE